MNAARLRRSGGSRASSKLLEFCDLTLLAVEIGGTDISRLIVNNAVV